MARAAILLAKHFEGLRDGDKSRPGLQPYLCPAKVATIGWGSTFYKDGRRVTMEDPGISIEEAEDLLGWRLEKDHKGVYRLIKVRLNLGQLIALGDFAYNCGLGALQSSTLRQRVNREDPDAADSFFSYIRSKGQILPGLVERRRIEAMLFRGGYDDDGVICDLLEYLWRPVAKGPRRR
jgi:lysozyme